MYNRYDGNSGRYVRVDDAPAPPPQRRRSIVPQPKPEHRDPTDIFSRLIPNAIAELDTEDVILILILYLMYRESGDKDLLIMLGSLLLP